MYARLKSDARHIKAMFQAFGWWSTSSQELARFNAACREHSGHDAITVSVDRMNGFADYKITTVSPAKDYRGFVVVKYEIIPAANLIERAEQITATGDRKHIGFSVGNDGYLLHESTYSPLHKTDLALLVDDWVDVLPTEPKEVGPELPVVNLTDPNNPIVTWKEVPYPVSPAAAQLFRLLIEHYPKPVSVKAYFPDGDVRTHRIKEKLPRGLRNLIDSGRGRPGTCLLLDDGKK